MQLGDSLITRYRPTDFDGVIGHSAVIASIEEMLINQDSRAFLLTGPSGVGKTTIARIIAKRVDCQPQDLFEIDAATNTGIDDMRSITGMLGYQSLTGTPKVVIVDEAHRLSPQAWSGLLKAVEEPGDAYWLLCTTDATKVPHTIKTRCARIDLKAVPRREIEAYLKGIAKDEDLGDLPDDVIALVAKESGGSVRKALVDLGMVALCRTRKEAQQVLGGVDEADAGVIDLCRYLIKAGPSGRLEWHRCAELLKAIAEQDPEGVRLAVVAYFSKVALGASDPRFALAVIDAFSTPCDRSTKVAPLLIAVGQLVFD